MKNLRRLLGAYVQLLDSAKKVRSNLNTHVFSGTQTLDVTEIGLHPFMLAYANDGFRDYALFPIFPLRLFRHKSIFIRTDRGIKSPSDLRGKTIAIAGYSSTSLTWIREILQDEYSIKPEDLQWIVSAKDSSAKDAGKVSKQENTFPKGVSIKMGASGKDESDLLASGEVGAILRDIPWWVVSFPTIEQQNAPILPKPVSSRSCMR